MRMKSKQQTQVAKLQKEKPNEEESSSFGKIAAVYLIGLLLGGIYVGLIAPLRTVVQADMGIDSNTGIWMINIYTLFYAAVIPVLGGLADRLGRRPVFLACLVFFAAGSLVCGVSQSLSSAGFTLLLVGRVLQAIGAGGIIPAATAEMGISAPANKRGMWLGIAAAVSGIANVLGASVGSVAISLVGAEQWSILFYGAIPICVIVALGGYAWLPRREQHASGKIDIAGSIALTAFVISMLLALKQAVEDFPSSAATWQFAAFAVICVIAAFVFVKNEQRAESPIFHMEYFRNKCMVIIMATSFFVGCGIISMQLIPEFAEKLLNAAVGSGGYYMTVIGIFAIAGPPTSGKLIDKFGAKKVLLAGLAVAALGFAFLATVAIAVPSVVMLLIGLAIMGLGMGFSMGTPLNYLCLQNVPENESTSAIATITLVRQIGTTLAPAVLVSFTTIGAGMQGYAAMLFAVVAANIVAMILVAIYPTHSA